MEIRELNNQQFENFTNKFNITSIYQTVEYGIIMNHQNFDTLFLGLMDDLGNILAASLILIDTTSKLKYAYAPRGFLIDYNNFYLLETFTKEIKKYFSKRSIVAVKISPLIIKDTHDLKYNVINHNNYYEKIITQLQSLGYRHLGYNNYFEALKPRYEAIIDLNIPYYIIFKNISKNFRTKIRNAESKGVKVYHGKEFELEYLYLQTKKKYPRDLQYFKECYNLFKRNNKVEFFYTKIDTEYFLKSITKKFHEQEIICENYNKSLFNIEQKKSKSLMNKKMEADKLLNHYKKELIRATNYLRDYPNGIVTSAILTIKNGEEVFCLMDGYDPKYKDFNSKHLMVWKLCERYSKLGFKKFNLGGITNPNIENNQYSGLNNFKLSFNAIANEYIGDLELITNNTLYFMYKNTPINAILKK